jgi:hypothetical protein
MQNQPDQTTLSMRNDPDGLIMSEARDATAIDNLEDAPFDFYGGVKTTTPNYSLKHARSGSDRWTASNSPLINATSPLLAVAILH